jgi:hypothetical protein
MVETHVCTTAKTRRGSASSDVHCTLNEACRRARAIATKKKKKARSRGEGGVGARVNGAKKRVTRIIEREERRY